MASKPVTRSARSSEVSKVPEEPTTLHGKPVKKSGVIWLDDGNIVLAAPTKADGEDERVLVAKVHRSVLQTSPVLQRRIEWVMEKKGEEMFGDTLLLYLEDAHGEDVEAFLQFIYGRTFLPYKHLDRYCETTDIVIPICRIATKYEFEDIRARIVSLLTRDWPAELHAWDENQKIIQARLDKVQDEDECDQCAPEPLSIIHVAKECHIPELLPSAFYHLNRVYFPNDVSGYNAEPLSVRFSYDDEFYPLDRTGLNNLLFGRERMRMFISRWTFDNLQAVCVDTRIPCLTKEKGPLLCGEATKEWWQSDATQTMMKGTAVLDPLLSLRSLKGSIQGKKNVCRPCKTKIIKMVNDARSTIWTSLPDWFNFKLGSKKTTSVDDSDSE